jgi:PAS domain S-box-containing protein
MGFYEGRTFPPEEREFVATLTKQCAQALERGALLEREEGARQWFATTLRSIGDAVIATDGRGGVIFMNDVAEGLTGWTVGEARGHSLDEVFCIFSERTHRAAESPVAKVLREGRVVGLANHTILRSRRGVETPIDDSAAPIRDDSGGLLGVVLVFRDVTNEKREEVRREFLARAGEALASSLDYPTTLATVAQFAVPELADWCTVDIVEPGSVAPRQVAMAHSDPSKVQFARELGERYPRDPNATTGPPQVIRTGKSELYTEISDALLESAAQDAEHARLLRQLRLESAMVVPLRGQSRTLGAMSFVYADSGRRYRESDLEFAQDFARRATLAIENALAMKAVEDARGREHALRREAEVASQTKDEFLATVSHELRTPLNAILGWTVLLRARKVPPELDHPLAIIERNARAQTKLIEDILDLSRIISGKLVLNLGPTNLATTIQASVETVTPAAEAKEIEMITDIADLSATMTADADRLQQIVWNLLANAVKFTPKGGRVFVRTYRDGSDVCISVRDTGEGVPPEALPFVFDRFQQADASTTRRHGGLGLGLAIVKQLVTAHGGTVRAISEGLGKGATFVVQMPARSAPSAVNAADGRLKTAAVVPGQSVTRLDGLRLLVIDDEDDARMLVGEVLKHQGAEVHLAASVEEALEKVPAVKPDVVVSDIGMPLTDGYSFIRKLRSMSPALGGQTPAIALTAYARREDANRAFAAGYQSHVAKPVEPETLARLVANLSGRFQDTSVS